MKQKNFGVLVKSEPTNYLYSHSRSCKGCDYCKSTKPYIDKVIEEFVHKWSRENVMAEGVDAAGQFATYYVKDLEDFIKKALQQQKREIIGEIEKWFGKSFMSEEFTTSDRVVAWTIIKKDWNKFIKSL